MTLQTHNWKEQLSEMKSDANVSIRYVNLSEIDGYGFFVSIIPAGEGTTGHYHPDAEEKYHVVGGEGTLLSLQVDQLNGGGTIVRQVVEEGMSVVIPALVVHRLVNTGKEPLAFFFECPMAHMYEEKPHRTAVSDFGGTLADIVGG